MTDDLGRVPTETGFRPSDRAAKRPAPSGVNPSRITPALALAAAIMEFERRLPGWWWSVGSCSVSRNASCGPDRNGPDAHLLQHREFDECFHHDGAGDVTDSLRLVMEYALKRRAALLERASHDH